MNEQHSAGSTETHKHTPGPWSVEDPMEGELSIVEANKPTHEWKFIATVYLRQGRDPDEFPRRVSAANARLIAAAPDLLQVLKELLASQLATMPPFEAGVTAQDRWSDRRAKARNDAAFVIAKAEGRS